MGIFNTTKKSQILKGLIMYITQHNTAHSKKILPLTNWAHKFKIRKEKHQTHF